MAKLFDSVFVDDGSGDTELVFPEESGELRLQCHSLILTQHPYFFKMMGATLREGRTREVIITDPHEEFVEILRYIYTGQIDVNIANVQGLLALADKYCIDEVLDLCLKFVQDKFDAETFFSFYNFTALKTSFGEKLKEQLMTALRQRRNLVAVSEDERWSELPVDFVEELLSLDDLPITSEAEVLRLIAHWAGRDGLKKPSVLRLLGTFRKSDGLVVHVSEIESLMQALGYQLFSHAEPRTGSSLWDPSFVVTRHEAAGNITTAPLSAATPDSVLTPLGQGESRHQLGPKDSLQQEPGWMPPGVHRCRVTLECSSWSHRERRLLRSSRTPIEAAALKRSFTADQHGFSSSKPSGHERSPSPPPKFQVRMPPIEAFETFDFGQIPDTQDAVRRNFSQDKIEHDLVDHQIICGVLSGSQRHGVRFSQRERSAIYMAEELNGKQAVNMGGTTTSVMFLLELAIGEATKNNISRCRFAVLRGHHTLLEEWFDVSAKVPLRFYISSMYFDSSSSYNVSVRWLTPT